MSHSIHTLFLPRSSLAKKFLVRNSSRKGTRCLRHFQPASKGFRHSDSRKVVLPKREPRRKFLLRESERECSEDSELASVFHRWKIWERAVPCCISAAANAVGDLQLIAAHYSCDARVARACVAAGKKKWKSSAITDTRTGYYQRTEMH